MEFKNPFSSRRVETLPDPVEPSTFDVLGGWAPAEAAAGQVDPYESEREQRAAGAEALARLYAQQAEARKQVMDDRLRGVQRGNDYRGRTA